MNKDGAAESLTEWAKKAVEFRHNVYPFAVKPKVIHIRTAVLLLHGNREPEIFRTKREFKRVVKSVREQEAGDESKKSYVFRRSEINRL
jgi:hypothetical protein